LKMDARAKWKEHAAGAVERSGNRLGKARAAVIDVLASQDCCVSAREIADELSESGVGIASVYRALDLLHRVDAVQRVDLGDGSVRYEASLPGGEHHHHAVCDSCGRVTPFEDKRLEEAIDRLSGRIPHAAGTHEVVLHGSCSRCERRPSARR
jgi:Fur family ferric uptake transcriptional regulator